MPAVGDFGKYREKITKGSAGILGEGKKNRDLLIDTQAELAGHRHNMPPIAASEPHCRL
jgi:hypothetical protein